MAENKSGTVLANLALAILLSPAGAIAHAEEPTQAAIDAAANNPGQIQKLLSGATPDCDPVATPVLGADPCTDLFRASCMNSDGSFKNQRKLVDQIERNIFSAHDAALKKMGWPSFEAGLADFLKKNGLNLKAGLDGEQKSALLAGRSPREISDWFENVPETCNSMGGLTPNEESRMSELKSRHWQAASNRRSNALFMDSARGRLNAAKQSRNEATDPEAQRKLDRQIASLERDIARYQAEFDESTRSQSAAHADILSVYQSAIARDRETIARFNERTASTFESDPEGLLAAILSSCSDTIPRRMREKTGPKEALPQECSPDSLYALRQASVALHLSENKEAAQRENRAFVSRTFPTYLKLQALENRLLSITLIPMESSADLAAEDRPLRLKEDEMRGLMTGVSTQCAAFKQRTYVVYPDIYSRFIANIARSKPAIEGFIDSVYGTDNKDRIESLYRPVHAQIMNFVENDLGSLEELNGSPKLDRIRTEMKGLDYSWIKKPSADLYSKDKDFPLPVLDFDKVPGNEMFLLAFRDPSMSFFKLLNAFYNPAIRQGELSTEEKVNLLPAVILLAKDDPIAAMTVIAHETAHKIGYQVSRMNGYDLTQAYSKLVECLSGGKSIRMLGLQSDEAISDWIASRVMGRLIMALPEVERRPAALRASGLFCQIAADEFYNSRPSTQLAHPETTLRINGIFGTNSDIRSALGCAGGREKSRFQECQLGGKAK